MKFNWAEIEIDENVLEQAHRIVNTKRQEDYGHPLKHFQKIAKTWSSLK